MTKRGNGQGSVRKLPSGRFRWEIMIEGRRFSGMAASKTLAQQALAGLIADATRGGIADPSTITVTEYLTQWLDERQKTRAPRTHEVQAAILRRYITPAIGDKRLQKLTPNDLQRLYLGMNANDLGTSTQRQTHQLLFSALKDAVRLEILMRNVADVVRPNPPRRDRVGLAAFTPDEAEKFLAAARLDRRGAVFEFAVSTGMRRGEFCGVRWIDVDLQARTAQVRETISDAGADGKIRTGTPKTANSRRTVHLSPDVVTLLIRQQEARQILAETMGEKWQDSGRVFTNLTGGDLRPNNLRRDMTRICQAAGIRTLNIHGLRHTYASLSLRHGVPVEVVSKQLGHASVGFTLSLYRTVYESEQASWAISLREMLSKAG
ncbi:tyrosine-type recombinase/integrase [Deinococcus alpinitundrae]|uniref:tyrosine-type recombinase/integrase n=1 Tax=Deinococcus alpinitundrae TaxID=468913 RepID=UPI001379AFF5|nr:tyrosine-type recombinase/integrase [Deinococcus alpinitundrae]